MSNQTAADDSTNLGELGEFFPAGKAKPRSSQFAGVPMQPGETVEEAVQRRAETTARIKSQLAKKNGSA